MGSQTLSKAVAGCFAVALSAGAAHAADLLGPSPAFAPEPVVSDIGGSWYLRGDVGVGVSDYGKTDIKTLSPGYPTTGYYGRQKEIGNQVFVGAGIGYELNSWVRFDVTGEYRTKSQWRYLEQDRNFGPANYNLTTGNRSAVVGLANAYFDLGTWYGITPFVGAGIGVAHHMFEGVTDQGLGGYAGSLGIARSTDSTRLAWALHAGLGYQVSQNLKLELAYRYLNMGDARVGTIVCQGTAASCGSPVLQTAYKLRDVQSHDFKIGMRWLLAGPVPTAAPVYEPAPGPLVRKY